jgi:hypothetical protein
MLQSSWLNCLLSLPLAEEEQTPSNIVSLHLVRVQCLLENLSHRLRLLVFLDTSLTQLLLAILSSIGVESEQYLSVAQRILLLDIASLGSSVSFWLFQHGLDFGAVDETSDISIADEVGWEEEVLLEDGCFGGGAIDIVESSEGVGSPDDESSQMTTRSELEEIECVDGRGLDTRNIAESTDEFLAISLSIVDDQRAAALSVSSSSEFSLACA